MFDKQYYVHILTNKKYGTLYTGVTSNLIQRINQHKDQLIESFTKKYSIYRLVYFETHTEIDEAILREKQIKKWKRNWKINLIEENNPYWLDLYNGII